MPSNRTVLLALPWLIAACGTQVDSLPDGVPGRAADAAMSGAPDAPTLPGADASPDAPRGPDATAAIVDLDGDGLDDAEELRLATAYLPYLSLDPADGCPRGGLLFRATPHPKDPTLVHILYDHLYEKDCGLGGHDGDDEVFAITVNPARPAPDGITAMIAISHQGTLCERTSECGGCDGLTACDTTPVGGAALPVVYASKDKHGTYVSATGCSTLTCFDQCTLAPAPAAVDLVNAGEPGHPLVHDLTTQGFITTANGWAVDSLMHFDPWDASKTFGGAGNVAGDLVDPAFDTHACR